MGKGPGHWTRTYCGTERACWPGNRSKKIQILPQTASYIGSQDTIASHSSAKAPEGLPFLESGARKTGPSTS